MTIERRSKPLGQLLKEQGFVTEEQIQFALKEQQATGERLGEVLVRLGIITDLEIAKVLAEQSNFPFVDIRGLVPERIALMKIPANFARERRVLPFRIEEGKLFVAVADPYDRRVLEGLARFAGMSVKIFVASSKDILKTIEWYYYFLQHPPEKEIKQIIEKLKVNPNFEFNVEQLLHNILILAISGQTTDIHLVPSEKSSRVYYRIDGLLELAFVFPQSVHSRLIGAIKVRAGMDIAEQRLPQDGRMRFEFLGDEYDLRISTVRAVYGENMVIRILPVRATVLHLSSLGFDQEETSLLKKLFSKPHGMIIVTGPTGSGKTTTLYSALRLIDAVKRNVLTAEDPVEYSFPLIRQTQINEEIGYNFAAAIKYFLRQDPDVILIGEIRDEETAIMAVRAAITGHLLLSTLHTNDAVSAITRLRDLGIYNSLLASSLLGITAQRLVRKVCPYCAENLMPDPYLLKEYGLPEDGKYRRGKGCENCRNTGYLGRTAITEVLVITETIKRLIANGATSVEILDVAREEGFKTLWDSAKKRVISGEISLEEAIRVLG